MNFNTTKDKFENIYTSDHNLSFSIAMFENNNLIRFLVFKDSSLKKYPQYKIWIDDVMIFDDFRNQDYGTKMIKR